jgi:hypothetical protein
VRCAADGKLIGAYLSDHGYPIITMFFDEEFLPGAPSACRDYALRRFGMLS